LSKPPRSLPLAKLCPMGMIFVPRVGGISHSPKELTRWEDCANGANVLLRTVLDLDQRDSIQDVMDLPGISIQALVFLGVVALILGARFGGWGRGMWPPRDM
jgi:hypothetical protein